MLHIVDAVYQCLIQVKDNGLRLRWVVRLRQVDDKMGNLLERWLDQICHTNVKERLHSLIKVNLLNIDGIWILIILLKISLLWSQTFHQGKKSKKIKYYM